MNSVYLKYDLEGLYIKKEILILEKDDHSDVLTFEMAVRYDGFHVYNCKTYFIYSDEYIPLEEVAEDFMNDLGKFDWEHP